MALKEFGKDYEYISKIIETKQVDTISHRPLFQSIIQPSQLEKFYNECSLLFHLGPTFINNIFDSVWVGIHGQLDFNPVQPNKIRLFGTCNYIVMCNTLLYFLRQ